MNKIQCPCLNSKGKPCSIGGEIRRNGFCHIHDPKGKFRKQLIRRREKRSNTAKVRLHKKYRRIARRKTREMANSITGSETQLFQNTVNKKQVYIFHLGFKGTYKVGISRDWAMRLQMLSASNPRIEPVLVFMGSQAHERAIHKAWSSYRVEREIFVFEERSEFQAAIQNVLQIVHPIDVIFKYGG